MAYFTSYAITRYRPGQSCQHLIEEINKQSKTRVIISFYFSKSSCLITVSTVIRLALRKKGEFCFPETLNVARGEAEKYFKDHWEQFFRYTVCYTWRRLAHKFAAVSRSTTWSRVSRKFKLLFPWGVRGFCSPHGVSEFWLTTRDMFSSNRKTYLSWEV